MSCLQKTNSTVLNSVVEYFDAQATRLKHWIWIH